MDDAIKGPMWAIELVKDGKHVGYLSGKSKNEEFVVVFTNESAANRAVAANSSQMLIPLPTPIDLGIFLRSIAKARMEKVGFHSGKSATILTIAEILKALSGEG